MVEYAFTLKFRLSDGSADVDQLVEKLFEAGCDDATIGTGKTGYIALSFDRESESAKEAVISAFQDVKTAIPDAYLVEASPDLVGVTEIAELLERTRQNIAKLITSHATTFPTPVHQGSSSLWRLSSVLTWAKDVGGYQIEDRLIELATCNGKLNVTNELQTYGGLSDIAPLLEAHANGSEHRVPIECLLSSGN